MPASSQSIRVENLSYSYPGTEGERRALDRVDLVFDTGKIYAVLGKNGSGKSTLAMCLNGLLFPTGGRVTSCGIDTSEAEYARSLKERVALIFQDPDTQLVGSTVEEEIAFGPENLGLPTESIRKRVDEALELVGIAGFARRQPQRLSQGQKQLVVVAASLAMEPSFLVSDESTSMLDYQSRMNVLELFGDLRARGMGIIHVTHFLEEAAIADEVVVLDDGGVAAFGKPGEILGDPVRVRELGLDPLPITTIVEEARSMGLEVPGNPLTVKDLLLWLSP